LHQYQQLLAQFQLQVVQHQHLLQLSHHLAQHQLDNQDQVQLQLQLDHLALAQHQLQLLHHQVQFL
jgi:hypothetical protein